ncbi:conjugal transfer protein [Pseudomonas sp. BRG-100]|uniref:P-type DNA transfer protein VirB5 n=1 Tax=Pseudomonas sp. BRG-100 TaxID=1524267 RepID=UPI0004E79B2A|nr:P-type DNA transfer protein VirB5 [Pseudomonas sp. BRG-100]KFF42178.1 conjugal transfer protein [Pseudomonas sp. BRG-100]
MKKTMIAAAISAALLTAALSTYAAVPGIPTLDGTTAMLLTNNAIQQAQEAMAALKTAKDGIKQAKAQYDNFKSIATGNDKLGDFLNNPALNKVLPMGQWADVYGTVKDIASLRERYGLKSDNVSVQAKFDRLLAAADALERNYDASTERVRNAEQLRARLNMVQTPQQKEDLQLRYQQELLEQQNQQMRMANMQMLVEQQDKIDNQKRAQAFSDYMKGKSSVLPKYD